MADEKELTQRGYLEILGSGEEPHLIHCPRRGKDMPLEACLGCQRYSSLAIDGTGEHVYLDCDWTGQEQILSDNTK
jgi:hypothetical protein